MEILPFTGYYITMLIIAIILDLSCPFLKIYWHFAFSIKQIKDNFQIWRIFTNFLVKPTRKVNIGILFDALYLYSHIYKLEYEAKIKKKYSTFTMTIIFLCMLNVLTTLAFYLIFDATESRSLVKELLYSFMAISSYKNPNDKTIVFFIPMKNKFVPIATFFFNASSTGSKDVSDLKKPIIGFISGYLFCLIVEKFEINITPNIIKKLFKEKINDNIYRRNDENDFLNNKKNKEPVFNINPVDTTKVAFRKKDSVAEGNEYNEFDKKNIKWE